MANFIFISPEGIPQYTVIAESETSYDTTILYNGLTCVKLPAGVTGEMHLNASYYKNGSFKTLPTKPAAAYTWDTVTETWQEPANYLDTLKTEALARIEASASTIKKKYIPETTDKLMTYLSQVSDAKKYALANYPANVNPYPWLKAAAAASGNSAQVEADILIAADETWNTNGSTVEEHLQGARNAIPNAPNKLVLNTLETIFNNAVSGF